MNLKKILDEILLEGNVSYNINTGKANPKTGYTVVIRGFEEKFSASKVSDQTLKAYVMKNMDALWGETRYLEGLLSDSDVYLDVSVHFEDLERAIYTGIINNQQCIYDCSDKVHINIPSPQTAGTETQKTEYAKQAARQLVSNQLN